MTLLHLFGKRVLGPDIQWIEWNIVRLIYSLNLTKGVKMSDLVLKIFLKLFAS